MSKFTTGYKPKKEGRLKRAGRWLMNHSTSGVAFQAGYYSMDHRYKVPNRDKVKISSLYLDPDAKVDLNKVKKFVKAKEAPRVGVVKDEKGRLIVIQGTNSVVAFDRMGKKRVPIKSAKELPLDELPQEWKNKWKKHGPWKNSQKWDEVQEDRRMFS